MAAFSGAFAKDASSFRFEGHAGPYAVGLRVVEQYDYSRSYRHATDEFGKPYLGERSRPLQTLVWYPAEHTKSQRMTVGDYGRLLATETNFGNPKLTSRAKEWLAGMARALATPLWAVRDSPPASGRFPLVIYAPSLSSMSWENADLCEYLASNGYVVIATPDMGVDTREMPGSLDGIEAEARDISFLVGYSHSLPYADSAAVAVAGFSWGGISNLFAAARDSRISALIAFDGSLRYSPNLVKQAGYVHPDEMTIPLLSFSVPMSFEDQDRYLGSSWIGPNVLNAWTHGDLVDVHMLTYFHDEFSSMYQRNEDTWWMWATFFPTLMDDSGHEDGASGYAWVARYTLQFLNAYLKNDANAMAFLKRTAAANGVPRHIMDVYYRPATVVAPTLDGFRSEIGRLGFGHLTEIYAAMRKQTPGFTLDEATITSWSDDLIGDSHVIEAIALLKLNVEIHPDSSNAHTKLGDAYKTSGQKQLAEDNYRTALDENPRNPFAAKGLIELQR